MCGMMERKRKRAGYFAAISAFVWAAAGTLCSCGAPKENSEILTAWVTGALELMAEAAKGGTNAAAEPNAELEISKTEEETLPEDTGGNPEESHNRMIGITVFEDYYFYENQNVSFEELILILDELEEGDVVTIYDDNAARNAYQKVMTVLEEREILYLHGEP